MKAVLRRMCKKSWGELHQNLLQKLKALDLKSIYRDFGWGGIYENTLLLDIERVKELQAQLKERIMKGDLE